MTAYNHQAYVEEALDSVARQRFRDFEIVVVDDGSTDETPQRIAAWISRLQQTQPNPVRLLSIANGGQSSALAQGFAHCRGQYICLLDSDDRWTEEKLEAVDRAALESPDAGMIGHPLYVIRPDGSRTGDIRPLRARLSDGDCRELLRTTGRHVAPPGVVIRADIFAQLLPMPTTKFTYGADAYLTFGATLLAPVRALSAPLGEYRLHPGGQYIGRMLSPEGLTRSLELQRSIAAHFGLEHVLLRNSFFLRNRFALAKLRGSLSSQLSAFGRLALATVQDRSFGWNTRLALLAYWCACLVAPAPAFRTLWRYFQSRQTGYGRATG
jgi:glycosyltransferase involved in cell wall biosynthesis